jgi:hypothetical protein
MNFHLAGADPVAARLLSGADVLAGDDIPVALQASVERHRANLARLITSLRRAGIGDSQIEASVSAVIASYKADLVVAIKFLVKGDDV